MTYMCITFGKQLGKKQPQHYGRGGMNAGSVFDSGNYTPTQPSRAVQHGAVADAAARPQDRGDFGSWISPDQHLDLLVRRG
jgi:hypothetical protein